MHCASFETSVVGCSSSSTGGSTGIETTSIKSDGNRMFDLDGGELLVAVATLVTEGRIPIATKLAPTTGSKSSCAGAASGAGRGTASGGRTLSPRGFREGPHCYRTEFLSSMKKGGSGGNTGGSSSFSQPSTSGVAVGGGMRSVAHQTASQASSGGASIPNHSCNLDDALCQKYYQVRSDVLNLWDKGIPLYVEVFLKHTCPCDVDGDLDSQSLLLERWYLHIAYIRSPDLSSSFNFCQLINAIRSQLYFSQISAWLTPNPSTSSPDRSGCGTKTKLLSHNFHYRLRIPGETFGVSKFREPENTHKFPPTDLGDGHFLHVTLDSLPRLSTVPDLKCPKCLLQKLDVDCESNPDAAVKRSCDRAAECEGRAGRIFDDRMHTRCTLKGKHRCDDLDEFDCAASRQQRDVLLIAKHKRLCNDDKNNMCCKGSGIEPHNIDEQGSSSSYNNYPNHRTNNMTILDSAEVCARALGDASTTYSQFDLINTSPSRTMRTTSSTNKQSPDRSEFELREINQNVKRSNTQDVEPHKAPKLDPEQLADVMPTMIGSGNKHSLAAHAENNRINMYNKCADVGAASAPCDNRNCDDKCVQRLSRLGASIQECARALLFTVQPAQSTEPHNPMLKTADSSSANMPTGLKSTADESRSSSQGTSINIFIDDNDDATKQSAGNSVKQAAKLRDVSNTVRDKLQKPQQYLSLKNALISKILPPPTRRRITFDDESDGSCNALDVGADKDLPVIISATGSKCCSQQPPFKHPDSPIPKNTLFRFPTILQPDKKQQSGQYNQQDNAVEGDAQCVPVAIEPEGGSVDSAGQGAIEIPSPLEKAKFRRSLGSAASMVFNACTGLPLTSSPAPTRRGNTSFEYDSSINSVSAIKRALFSGSLSTDEESESDGSVISPCSPDTYLYNSHHGPVPPRRHLNRVVEGVADCAFTADTNFKQKPRHGASFNQSSIYRHTSSNLLGTFEESVLKGRLEPSRTVQGFRAELGASGSFVPRHLKVPVTVFFFALGDSDKVASPYLAHLNLGKKGYCVPRTGTIQVTLFNPLDTVVKMFVIMYNLADMPPNSQTFLRQRTLYMPTHCKEANVEWGPKWLRYSIHLRFLSSKSGKIYLHSDVRMIIFRKCDMDTATAHDVDMCYEWRSFTHTPQNPRYSPRK